MPFEQYDRFRFRYKNPRRYAVKCPYCDPLFGAEYCVQCQGRRYLEVAEETYYEYMNREEWILEVQPANIDDSRGGVPDEEDVCALCHEDFVKQEDIYGIEPGPWRERERYRFSDEFRSFVHVICLEDYLHTNKTLPQGGLQYDRGYVASVIQEAQQRKKHERGT